MVLWGVRGVLRDGHQLVSATPALPEVALPEDLIIFLFELAPGRNLRLFDTSRAFEALVGRTPRAGVRPIFFFSGLDLWRHGKISPSLLVQTTMH